MDVREKLVELLSDAGLGKTERYFLADYLIAHGVTVQEQDYFEYCNDAVQVLLAKREKAEKSGRVVISLGLYRAVLALLNGMSSETNTTQFETANKEYFLLMQETARRCLDHKSKTNAERILSMNDEELSDFLDKCEARGYQDSSIARDSSGHCIDMIEWLKQPAE